MFNCFSCGEEGHYARNCPDKKKEQGQRPISSTSIQKKTRHMKEAKRRAAG
jgi:hypothetical protein